MTGKKAKGRLSGLPFAYFRIKRDDARYAWLEEGETTPGRGYPFFLTNSFMKSSNVFTASRVTAL